MSFSWTADFIGTLNEAKRKEAIQAAAERIIMMTHDNIKLKSPVRSQRADKQSASDNGTAITMYALPKSASVFEDPSDWKPFLDTLRSRRLDGRAPRLTWDFFNSPERLKRVRGDYVMDVLDFLRMIPGMEKSKVLKSDRLMHTPGPQQLPHGKKHRTEMYMLPNLGNMRSIARCTSPAFRTRIYSTTTTWP
jgi:hypothetical protein